MQKEALRTKCGAPPSLSGETEILPLVLHEEVLAGDVEIEHVCHRELIQFGVEAVFRILEYAFEGVAWIFRGVACFDDERLDVSVYLLHWTLEFADQFPESEAQAALDDVNSSGTATGGLNNSDFHEPRGEFGDVSGRGTESF